MRDNPKIVNQMKALGTRWERLERQTSAACERGLFAETKWFANQRLGVSALLDDAGKWWKQVSGPKIVSRTRGA